MRAGLLALLSLLVPSTVLACRAPPHTYSDFSRASYVGLPACEEQGDGYCPDIPGVTAAWYAAPTDRYQHGILGDAIEGGRLHAYITPTDNHNVISSCGDKSITLDAAHVFEDTKPRLVDVDGDGRQEIVTVRSHRDKGAQLAIYADIPQREKLTLIASTPYIGQRNRWLAPIGAADLDGDGHIEIAYIDRPHLAKTLRVWRFKGGALTEIAAASGLTNHRIGERDIAGGIRDCGNGPEMITATADWSRIVAVRLVDGALQAQAVGPHEGRNSFAAALNCQ